VTICSVVETGIVGRFNPETGTFTVLLGRFTFAVLPVVVVLLAISVAVAEYVNNQSGRHVWFVENNRFHILYSDRL
jgi:hypothetical protein